MEASIPSAPHSCLACQARMTFLALTSLFRSHLPRGYSCFPQCCRSQARLAVGLDTGLPRRCRVLRCAPRSEPRSEFEVGIPTLLFCPKKPGLLLAKLLTSFFSPFTPRSTLILSLAQTCSTQSCCKHRIAPWSLHWAQDCPAQSCAVRLPRCSTKLRQRHTAGIAPALAARLLQVKTKEWERSRTHSSKQSSDPVVPWGMHRHLPWPQQVRQNCGSDPCLREFTYLVLPSISTTAWIPVKKYIEEDLEVNTEREQAYWDEWTRRRCAASSRSRKRPRSWR